MSDATEEEQTMRYSEDYIYGEPFDPQEFSAQCRQVGIRFRKAATEATKSIEAFVAVWEQGRNAVSTADIRRGTVV